MFDASRRDAFAAIKVAVEERVRDLRQARLGAPQPAPDVMDQIVKLADLRDAGIITADEFEAKKSDLLQRL